MLRPLEWLGAHHAQVGSSIHLDMPELGATGQARVLGIYPCPAIQEGPGQVVTATFAHPATHQILNVTIGAGPNAETIGVTETHPFWSVKHNAFVPIGQLSVGDEVLTLHGQTKRIETLLPRPGPAEKVYNLEVHGEHTYFVGQQQLLVHNSGCREEVLDAVRGFLSRDADGPLANLTKLDPKAKFGIRGSTATGRVGNPNKQTFGQAWNPNEFDLDLFIQSDELYRQFGSKLIEAPGVRESLVRQFPELFHGLRGGGKGVSIKIFSTNSDLSDAIFF